MELLERYLRAVKPGLPKAQREDILAELAENITAQMEDKAAELGHPLTEAEQEEVLQQFGHPLVVAGRYQPGAGTLTFGRTLIGAELFPFYLRGVKWAVGLAVGIVSVVNITMSLINPSHWENLIPALLFHSTLQFLIQTAVWTGIQAHYTKYPVSWNAKSLPKLPTKVERVPIAESIFQLVIYVLAVPWLQAALGQRYAVFGPIKVSGAWHDMYVPVMGVMTVTILQSVVNIFRPDWVRFRLITRISTSLVMLGVSAYLLSVGNLVTLTDKIPMTLAKRQIAETWVYYTFFTTFVAISLISLGQMVFDVRKLVRRCGGPVSLIFPQGADIP
jgi:hypothetical protein